MRNDVREGIVGKGSTVLKGGMVVDGSGTPARRADVVIEDGRIVAIEATTDVARAETLVIDAAGCIVGPGLVDLRTHLREPGGEQAETIESGCRAAAVGGYTAVVAMPDTEPTTDSAAVVRLVQDLALGAACQVVVAGAITVGRKGEQLAPMAEMAKLGVRLFTDAGSGVQDAGLLRRAMEYAAAHHATIAQHCADEQLAKGVMHEGAVSAALGLAGIPAEAEEVMVMQNLSLARLTGARLHLSRLSTSRSVALLRAARNEGVKVSAEVTPHHLSLTDETARSFDPVFRVDPPLRSAHHRDALRAAVADGVIDAIATDHEPLPAEAKELPFGEAPTGVVGLETALAAVLTDLQLPEEVLFRLLSTAPAAIAGVGHEHGVLAVGRPANIVVIDPTAEWTVEPSRLIGRSSNTPFAGRRLTGRVQHTMLRGALTVRDGEVQR